LRKIPSGPAAFLILNLPSSLLTWLAVKDNSVVGCSELWLAIVGGMEYEGVDVLEM